MIEVESFGRYWGTDTRYLGNGRYLIVAPTLAGGKAYAILADFFIDVLQSFDIDVRDRNPIYERMNELARSQNKGVDFTPFFLGSRTHGENERASISNLNASNFTASSLTRALLEGMINEVKEPYDLLPGGLKGHEGLVASGNGMRRNTALRTVAESAFGLPLRVSNFEEEAALGAAITASKAIS
jgi:sedoheptulokinase